MGPVWYPGQRGNIPQSPGGPPSGETTACLSLLIIYSIKAISGPLRSPHLGSCWLASPCEQLCGITKLNSLLNTPFELYFNVHEDRIKVTFSSLPP